MLCKSPAPIGGDSVLVDGYEIRAVLASRFPEALRELSRPASVVFGGGDAFHAGAIFEDGPGGIHIRFRYDNLAYFSPPLIPLMPSFLSLLDERAFSFRLGAGQGYIVDNRRWLHGRTAFSGPREMHRLLVRRR
jgi:hypothetical protein